MIKKEVVVSGIRPTNSIHVGNYLSALKPYLELQKDKTKRCYFFIADLHAITTPFTPKELRDNTLNLTATYLAAGLDPNKSVFFVQSHILEHAELGWILNCLTPLGELERMTQFKDKSKQHGRINAGLLNYPTQMAADILIYKANLVPVGEDQIQHLELTRILAKKFNHKFGHLFPEPKPFTLKPLRIKSLLDPSKKMSKTNDEALMIDDSPAEIKRKLKKAVTATGAEPKSWGVENLMLLLEHFGSTEENRYFKAALKSNTIRYSELKDTLANAISEHLAEFRYKHQQFLQDKNYLSDVLAEGAVQARKITHATLLEVKTKLGLI